MVKAITSPELLDIEPFTSPAAEPFLGELSHSEMMEGMHLFDAAGNRDGHNDGDRNSGHMVGPDALVGIAATVRWHGAGRFATSKPLAAMLRIGYRLVAPRRHLLARLVPDVAPVQRRASNPSTLTGPR